jgi:hypothetical protein
LTDQDRSVITELIYRHLIPAIDRWKVTVVDGGTDSGIMRLIGHARASLGGSFQLIGVAAAGTVRLPGFEQPRPDAADVEPHHSHLVLVPGARWGDETPWLSAATQAISSAQPSVTLVVNGGTITVNDAVTSLRAQRPVVVLKGSGRAADEIAMADQRASRSQRAKMIAQSPLTTIVSVGEPRQVVQVIAERLNTDNGRP